MNLAGLRKCTAYSADHTFWNGFFLQSAEVVERWDPVGARIAAVKLFCFMILFV
jgi:hypothetical protein